MGSASPVTIVPVLVFVITTYNMFLEYGLGELPAERQSGLPWDVQKRWAQCVLDVLA